MRLMLIAAAVAAGLFAVKADAKEMTLAADTRLEASGLLQYLVPRFALKTSIRVTVLPLPAAELQAAAASGSVDAMIAPEALARSLRDAGQGAGLRPAFHRDGDEGAAFAVLVVPAGPGAEHAPRFVDWLLSEIGQRTVASFAPEAGAPYVPGAMKVEAVEVVLPEGDEAAGEKLAHFHCGRCHVISAKNRFGGIGSTPSFPALRAIPDWFDKFQAFWAAPPHPSFTQVEGITEPFDPARPPHIAPVEISEDDLAAIVAYAASIEPKDLGAEVQAR